MPDCESISSIEMTQTKRYPALFVAVPSAQADQTEAALHSVGLGITRADNICVAEMYAESHPFEAAVYDQSLTPEEQVSLARVMRIRWPWIRILRLVSEDAPAVEDKLFDCSARSASQLVTFVESALGLTS